MQEHWYFGDFSECVLIDHSNYLDFDSAIPRFESWRPSQLISFKKVRSAGENRVCVFAVHATARRT
jgi:hypothetical protein